MRLGDLDALKKAIDTIKQTGYDINEEPVEFVELPDLIKAIDNAPTIMPKEFEPLVEAIIDVLPAIVEKAERIGEWIPVTRRPMTDDEWEELSDEAKDYIDEDEKWFFDCPMPEDGQEILVSTRWGVHTDVADNDIDGEGFISHGLEENGDWEGVLAWMPVPEPYKEGDEK